MTTALDQAQMEMHKRFAESQRMATTELAASISERLEKRGIDAKEDIVAALEETWEKRKLNTPESGWDPS